MSGREGESKKGLHGLMVFIMYLGCNPTVQLKYILHSNTESGY